MDYMICIRGKEEDIKYLKKLEELNIGLELGSYAFVGVRSKRDWNNRIKTHKEIVKNFSGRVVIHGPFVGIMHSHIDYLIKNAIKARMEMTYQMINELKPTRLVLHTGYSEDVSKFNYNEEWIQSTSQYWSTEIKRYEDIGVEVVLENLTEKEPFIMKKIINNVNSDYLGLCIDVGHLHVFSNVKLEKWIKTFNRSLKHIHIHDNFGKEDQHLPVGKGKIDFDELFYNIKVINPGCTISLEIDSDMETKLENILFVIDRYKGETEAPNG